MSLNALAADLVSNNVDNAGSMMPSAAGRNRRAKTAPQSSKNTPKDAFNALVKYIPTESITLFVASLSAAPLLKNLYEPLSVEKIYWFYTVATPVILFLILMGKRKRAGKTRLPLMNEFPWWALTASTVAFMGWALSVPTGPYLQGANQAPLTGFIAIFISAFLSLFEGIFD